MEQSGKLYSGDLIKGFFRNGSNLQATESLGS